MFPPPPLLNHGSLMHLCTLALRCSGLVRISLVRPLCLVSRPSLLHACVEIHAHMNDSQSIVNCHTTALPIASVNITESLLTCCTKVGFGNHMPAEPTQQRHRTNRTHAKTNRQRQARAKDNEKELKNQVEKHRINTIWHPSMGRHPANQYAFPCRAPVGRQTC